MATEKKMWFTSDLHLGHEAILHYTARADHLQLTGYVEDGKTHFSRKEIDDHDWYVVDTINEYADLQDTLYILGDLTYHRKYEALMWIDRIRCQNKYLILGNHDDNMIELYRSSGLFKEVLDYKRLIARGHALILFHYPILEWRSGHYNSWHLHGHCHGNLNYEKADLHDKRILDVSWDNSKKYFGKYRPFEFEDVKKFMTHEDRKQISHHGD